MAAEGLLLAADGLAAGGDVVCAGDFLGRPSDLVRDLPLLEQLACRYVRAVLGEEDAARLAAEANRVHRLGNALLADRVLRLALNYRLPGVLFFGEGLGALVPQRGPLVHPGARVPRRGLAARDLNDVGGGAPRGNLVIDSRLTVTEAIYIDTGDWALGRGPFANDCLRGLIARDRLDAVHLLPESLLIRTASRAPRGNVFIDNRLTEALFADAGAWAPGRGPFTNDRLRGAHLTDHGARAHHRGLLDVAILAALAWPRGQHDAPLVIVTAGRGLLVSQGSAAIVFLGAEVEAFGGALLAAPSAAGAFYLAEDAQLPCRGLVHGNPLPEPLPLDTGTGVRRLGLVPGDRLLEALFSDARAGEPRRGLIPNDCLLVRATDWPRGPHDSLVELVHAAGGLLVASGCMAAVFLAGEAVALSGCILDAPHGAGAFFRGILAAPRGGAVLFGSGLLAAAGGARPAFPITGNALLLGRAHLPAFDVAQPLMLGVGGEYHVSILPGTGGLSSATREQRVLAADEERVVVRAFAISESGVRGSLIAVTSDQCFGHELIAVLAASASARSSVPIMLEVEVSDALFTTGVGQVRRSDSSPPHDLFLEIEDLRNRVNNLERRRTGWRIRNGRRRPNDDIRVTKMMGSFKSLLENFVIFALPQVLIFYPTQVVSQNQDTSKHKVQLLKDNSSPGPSMEEIVVVVLFVCFATVWTFGVLFATFGQGRRCLNVVGGISYFTVISVVALILFALSKTMPEERTYTVPFGIYFIVLTVLITWFWKTYVKVPRINIPRSQGLFQRLGIRWPYTQHQVNQETNTLREPLLQTADMV